MADIITRLRDRAYAFKAVDKLCEEAADEIESLRRKLAVIERFAETGNMFEAMFGTPVSRAGQKLSKSNSSRPNCTERDNTNHDAAPAARAPADSCVPRRAVDCDSDGTDKADPLTRNCGTGDISEAQIDALEFVVEEGRIANIEEYGILRQLLIRLRQEWEFRDSPEPIAGCNIDRLKPVKDAAPDRPEPIKIDLSQPCMVDPPSGWQWGFPRRYDPASDGPMKEWLVRNGYPKHLADKGLTCTFTLCDKETTDK